MGYFKCWRDTPPYPPPRYAVICAQTETAGVDLKAAEWLRIWNIAVDYEKAWLMFQRRYRSGALCQPTTSPPTHAWGDIRAYLHIADSKVEIVVEDTDRDGNYLALRMSMEDLLKVVQLIQETWPDNTHPDMRVKPRFTLAAQVTPEGLKEAAKFWQAVDEIMEEIALDRLGFKSAPP